MPRLADIQMHMRQAVVVGDDAGIVPLLLGGRDPGKRLQIHRRQYETSLITALLGKYPATMWLVGSPFVTEAARRYVREYPPHRPCIAEYGEAFPAFLAARPGAGHLQYLRTFSELEWHVGHVAIAIDRPAVPLEELSRIPADALPGAVFTLQSGLRYLEAPWPVDELMRLYLTDTAPESLEFRREDVWIQVCGARGEFRMDRLTRGEFMFRKSIFEGRSAAGAAEAALDAEAGFEPVRALVALVTDRLLTAIKPHVQEQQ